MADISDNMAVSKSKKKKPPRERANPKRELISRMYLNGASKEGIAAETGSTLTYVNMVTNGVDRELAQFGGEQFILLVGKRLFQTIDNHAQSSAILCRLLLHLDMVIASMSRFTIGDAPRKGEGERTEASPQSSVSETGESTLAAPDRLGGSRGMGAKQSSTGKDAPVRGAQGDDGALIDLRELDKLAKLALTLTDAQGKVNKNFAEVLGRLGVFAHLTPPDKESHTPKATDIEMSYQALTPEELMKMAEDSMKRQLQHHNDRVKRLERIGLQKEKAN